MLRCLMVGLGGFAGTVCRYLIGLIPLGQESGFPYKTLFINIAGAFLIGLIAALAAAENRSVDPELALVLRVGVCGGFTTFSTFAYESLTLLGSRQFAPALIYIVLSTALGILAVYGAGQLVSMLAK